MKGKTCFPVNVAVVVDALYAKTVPGDLVSLNRSPFSLSHLLISFL